MIDQYNVNVLQRTLEGLGLKPVSVSEEGFYTRIGSVMFEYPNTLVAFLECLAEHAVEQEVYISKLEDDIVTLDNKKQTLEENATYIRNLLREMKRDTIGDIDNIIAELEGKKTDDND